MAVCVQIPGGTGAHPRVRVRLQWFATLCISILRVHLSAQRGGFGEACWLVFYNNDTVDDNDDQTRSVRAFNSIINYGVHIYTRDKIENIVT